MTPAAVFPTPQDVRTTTIALNMALEQFNGIFRLIPLTGITAAISSFDWLDSSVVVQKLYGDSGRMHVALSNDIYFVMLWSRYETTGNFEIICYATSNYDDHRVPYTTQWTSKERSKKRRELSKLLATVQTYHRGKGYAFSIIEEMLAMVGFDFYEFQDQTSDSAFVGGKEGRITCNVGHETYVTVCWYQMESGNYEITVYAS